jgi:hypothetical protein
MDLAGTSACQPLQHSDHRPWPPKHLDRLQLYLLPTPNGLKVSIMPEEIA